MYDNNWDQYYHNTYKVMKKKALWDVPPSEAVAQDHLSFAQYFDNGLPILDLGCGTGAQSEFLSNYYPSVLGVDVAAKAIEIAKEEINKQNVTFDVMDITEAIIADKLPQNFIPCNIYMRGVLHQIKDKDIPTFQKNIRTLLGEKGKLFAVEVGDSIRDYFNNSTDNFSELPTRMKQVFISNLPPRGLSKENATHYFPSDKFNILHAEASKLNTNIKFKNGNAIFIPALAILIDAVN